MFGVIEIEEYFKRESSPKIIENDHSIWSPQKF